jgi:hypothetical protein
MGMHLFSQVIGFSEDKREQMRRTISEMHLGGDRKARAPPPPPGAYPRPCCAIARCSSAPSPPKRIIRAPREMSSPPLLKGL